MKLDILVKMQKAGALKVGADPEVNGCIIGGMSVSMAQCAQIAYNLGWVGRKYEPPYELIKRTESIVRNLKPVFENTYAFHNISLEFENIRISDSLSSFDRIVIHGPNETLTLIKGNPSLGCQFNLFNRRISDSQPVFKGKSYKAVREYIASLIEREDF